jgi:hypothetical protein
MALRRNRFDSLAASSLTLPGAVHLAAPSTLGLFEADRQRLVVERQRNELAERNRALQAAHEDEHLLSGEVWKVALSPNNERARQAIESVTSETAIEQLTRQKELRPEQLVELEGRLTSTSLFRGRSGGLRLRISKGLDVVTSADSAEVERTAWRVDSRPGRSKDDERLYPHSPIGRRG